ncbi:diacylglycerol kinase family protein [Isoptericola sp. b441]|uniref:Diacylglycerol kinase family protein n=1 Tax=Actinotalea lenta TaxID=3064654 RepID=A0ABT9D5B6_9CELL|nr:MULTISPECIES: diacylglycerol kinase family protein [unclassified Isoptericola]MDO8105975.1 diacylglycerol kinase family protein [Isoptericola sp. b441]MDO8122306.1 diacylglycerol kinase family protein [Isoptericola sp. b490]
MSWQGWVSLLAVLVALVAVTIAVQNRRHLHGLARRTRAPEHVLAAGVDRPLVAFVANPVKPGAAELRERALQACADRYLPEPLWYETTPDDPGVGQARQALADGAQVVVAVGGDGTVRAVAEGLTGSEAAMALLPQGTGNLLARNLDLPLSDLDAQLRVALGGHDRAIDVGWLTVLRDERDISDPVSESDPRAAAPDATAPEAEDPSRRHIFLVIGGIGFDAAMVADADEDLKARVGWIAYFFAGIRHLHSRRMRVEARLDDADWYPLRLRSLLIGNCGRLPGGITLLPDAVLDDGWLDVGAIDTRAGLLGWTQLFGEVVVQRFGVRAELPASIGHIDHARAHVVRVRSRDSQQVQVDGDIVGSAFELEARVDHRALRVRVP